MPGKARLHPFSTDKKERQSQTCLHYRSNMHWTASSAIAKRDRRGLCCLMFPNLNGKGNEGICCNKTLITCSHFLGAVFAAGSFHSNLNIKCFSSLFPGEGQFQRGMETLNSSYQSFVANEILANLSPICTFWNDDTFILLCPETISHFCRKWL